MATHLQPHVERLAPAAIQLAEQPFQPLVRRIDVGAQAIALAARAVGGFASPRPFDGVSSCVSAFSSNEGLPSAPDACFPAARARDISSRPPAITALTSSTAALTISAAPHAGHHVRQRQDQRHQQQDRRPGLRPRRPRSDSRPRSPRRVVLAQLHAHELDLLAHQMRALDANLLQQLAQRRRGRATAAPRARSLVGRACTCSRAPSPCAASCSSS